MAGDIEQHIRARAYEIWEDEGKPEGRAHEHWEIARSEFSDAAGGAKSKARKTAAKSPRKAASAPKAAPAPSSQKKPRAAAKPTEASPSAKAPARKPRTKKD